MSSEQDASASTPKPGVVPPSTEPDASPSATTPDGGDASPGPISNPPGPEAGTTPSGPDTVYDNGGLVLPWYDASWTTRELDSTTVLDDGKHTLSVTFEAWAALCFDDKSGIAPGTYDTLSFDAYGGANTKPQLAVVLYVNDNWGIAVPLAPYCDGGFIPTSAWTHCSMPLGALGVATQTFTEIAIEEIAGDNLAPMALSTIQLVIGGTIDGGVDAGSATGDPDAGSPVDAGSDAGDAGDAGSMVTAP